MIRYPANKAEEISLQCECGETFGLFPSSVTQTTDHVAFKGYSGECPNCKSMFTVSAWIKTKRIVRVG